MAKIELKHVESEVSYLPKARRWECRILTQGKPSFRLVLTRRKADARLMGEIFVAQAYRKMAMDLVDDNNAKCDRAEAMVSWRSSWPFHSTDAPLAEPPQCCCMSRMYRAPAVDPAADLELEEEWKRAGEMMAELRLKQFNVEKRNRTNAMYPSHKRDDPSV